MYKDLPYRLRRQVKRLLQKNQFLKAKAVHDSYMEERNTMEEALSERKTRKYVITHDKRCVNRMRVLH